MGPDGCTFHGENYCFGGIHPFFCKHNEVKASKHINLHLLSGNKGWQPIIFALQSPFYSISYC